MRRILHPAGWPPPRGYSHGIEVTGRLVFVAGQIGWDAAGRFAGPDLVSQARQALANVVAVLREADLGPEHVVRLTWYVVDMDEYRAAARALGRAYREVMGRHYPPMAVVEVTRLVEPEARVEIEATAVG